MDKEIKFRGQNIISKEWVYGSYISAGTASRNRFHFIIPNWKYNEKRNEAERLHMFIKSEKIMVSPHTIDQFTGLYDSNKKEIYERDILRFYSNGDEFTLCVIANNKIDALCAILKEGKYINIKQLGELLCNNIEVIGNVRENLELLIKQ